jgi:hypothetical protein
MQKMKRERNIEIKKDLRVDIKKEIIVVDYR